MIGINAKYSEPVPVLLWKNVGYVLYPRSLGVTALRKYYRAGVKVTAQFIPKLRLYVVEDYQQNEILKNEIDRPFIWESDLSILDPSTTWDLTRDEASGDYEVTSAD